jgi:hypothetical protein
MSKRRIAIASFAVAASLAATSAFAQSSKNATVLPLWNGNSGKVEALLLLEPTTNGGRWQMGSNSLSASLGLSGGDTLGVICKNSASTSAISSLSGNCVLAAVDGDGSRNATSAFSGVSLTRNGGKIGVLAGGGTASLPNWLSNPGLARNSQLNQNILTVFGAKNIGREATISIGGTLARARLVPANDVPALADRWDMQSLSVGAGYGNFSASIVGRVVETPNQPKYRNVGLGLNWRAPWKGEFSIGAESVVTRGKNPFADNTSGDEGAVPYVRYQQGL